MPDAPVLAGFDPSIARRALVVRGGWDGHQPVEATDLFIPFLRESGFAVDVETSAKPYADADYLAGLDLIVQCNTMSSAEGDEIAGLRAAVAAGVGFAGWHGGIADSYRNSSDYLQLVGGQFATHPGKHPSEREGGQADNYVRHTIDVLPVEHPITSGLESFELVTEQYWVLTDDYNDVLATTTHPAPEWEPWHRPIICPAVWTRRWGQGRVFVCTPGHRVEVLQDPNVDLLVRRGLLWASRPR